MLADKYVTYDQSFYLDEFVERDVMCFLELFANVEKVNLTTGDHDANQCSVICAKTLQWGDGGGGQQIC